MDISWIHILETEGEIHCMIYYHWISFPEKLIKYFLFTACNLQLPYNISLLMSALCESKHGWKI